MHASSSTPLALQIGKKGTSVKPLVGELIRMEGGIDAEKGTSEFVTVPVVFREQRAVKTECYAASLNSRTPLDVHL